MTKRPFFLSFREFRHGGIYTVVVLGCAVLLALDGPFPLSSIAGVAKQTPATILDLQPFRQTTTIRTSQGGGEAVVSLTNVNANINAWYLIRIDRRETGQTDSNHLENASPETLTFLLSNRNPEGLLACGNDKMEECDLWGSPIPSGLGEARQSRLPYASLCGGKIYLRNATKGHRTGIERVTEFLRDKIPGGEGIVSFVRDTVFTRIYREKALRNAKLKPPAEPPVAGRVGGPAPAHMDPKDSDRAINPVDLEIETEDAKPTGMIPGTWYGMKNNPGVYASVITPNGIASEIMQADVKTVGGLSNVELAGVVYLVAFDLDRFDLRYALGTIHPRVGWAAHMNSAVKDKSAPGPDGIGTIAPLVSTGLINPVEAGRTVAAFTGGFKREHGAFKYGPLALKNNGSHYGFIENGVIFSRLQPGLSTLYALKDGWADMKTWSEEDNALVPKIRYARQNGVPLVSGFDRARRMSIPGAFVARWGEGNWSGSADKKLQTMRAGAGLQEVEGRRFLLYAFFWSATPSAMARVFQAFQCRHAMLLDMNALEHTYLAVYRRQGSNLYVQHLIRGMSQVDISVKGAYVPRFLGYADDRDFFYLTKKEGI
jgi:hypothetical protein